MSTRMPRFDPIGFVVTHADSAPPTNYATANQARRAVETNQARRDTVVPATQVADEDAPTVRLPCFDDLADFAHAPTVLEGGWSRPH